MFCKEGIPNDVNIFNTNCYFITDYCGQLKFIYISTYNSEIFSLIHVSNLKEVFLNPQDISKNILTLKLFRVILSSSTMSC